MKAAAIFHIAPGKTEVGEIRLNALKADEVLIEANCSAISAGTEAMIYRGHMPSGISQDATIASLAGGFDYPFRYGYALAGTIVESGADIDREWLGRKVFVFHPHQSRLIAPLVDCFVIPDDVPFEDALFLANMESALSFVHDANPPFGARVMVFGLGIVGLLTSLMLSRLSLSDLIVAEPLAYRRQKAREFGLTKSVDPSDPREWQTLIVKLFDGSEIEGVDIAFEISGSYEALNQAIEVTGFSGTILACSWYGTQSRPLDLGGHFHRRRIAIGSSQVSSLKPSLSGRWNKKRRIELAWRMIREIRPAALISHRFSVAHCDQAFRIASQAQDSCLQIVFDYS